MKIKSQGIITHREGQGAYMPWVRVLKSGRVIAAQHTGSQLGAADNRVEVLVSDRLGGEWTSLGNPFTGPEHEGWAYRAPEITIVADDHILMKVNRFDIQSEDFFDPESGEYVPAQMWLYHSYDEGQSWTDGVEVDPGIDTKKFNCVAQGQVQILADDLWLFPFEIGQRGAVSSFYQAGVVSRDQGKTWGEYREISRDPEGIISYCDQRYTCLENGHIYATAWTCDLTNKKKLVNHMLVSQDQGFTWSKPLPINVDGEICNPQVLPDGRVAVVYNDRFAPQGIKVAVTEDYRHFNIHEAVTVFDPAGETNLGKAKGSHFLSEHVTIAFGRPGITLLESGELLTYFWCTENGVTHTRWVSLDID